MMHISTKFCANQYHRLFTASLADRVAKKTHSRSVGLTFLNMVIEQE